MAQNTQFRKAFKLLLYRLKRQFESGPVDFYFNVRATTNKKNGIRTIISRDVRRVKTAIVLPERSVFAIVQTITKIGADKQFVFGGQYNRQSRVFMVDGNDMTGVNLTINDYLVYNSTQYYQIAEFTNYYDGCAFLVMGQEQPGESFSQVHETDTYDTFALSETAADS